VTDKITPKDIQEAIDLGFTDSLNTTKLMIHLLSSSFSNNIAFMESRGLDVDRALVNLDILLSREEIELEPFHVFAAMKNKGRTQTITPSCEKIIETMMLKAQQENRDMFFEDFLNILYEKEGPKVSDVLSMLESCGYIHAPNNSKNKLKNKYKELYSLCEDLNEKAKNKKIDPLIGRQEEVQRMVEILAHHKKKNPLLVGPPGVGKTQVVLGLASLSEQKMLPKALSNIRVFSLEVATLLGGTKFRGDFEQRVTNLVKDLKNMAEETDIQPILFIDELHQIMGAGAGGQGQGSTDLSNIIKPALASGEISVIGSTTDDEYKQHISKDKALTRRFQQVKIEEPSAKETLRILDMGIRPVLERYHNVKFPYEVLERAVELSGKYITQQYFPDKAISLIDSIGAKLKTDDKSKRKTANISDVENTVSIITGTPVSVLKKKVGKDSYVDLEALVKKELYGQNEAIEKVVQSYELAKAGLSDEGQPIGSWLLLGPTGTGKTELAKLIAKYTESHFFKINMGEYGEKHSPAKLFGAPPGYEGHRDGGLLTNEITKYPHSVLLLDEIEKAHEKVYEALLGVLDGGSMTDGEGNKVDFSNVLILMTSNAGAAITSKTKRPVGFSNLELLETEAKVKVKTDVINNTFSPEFRNKLSGMIEFNALSKDIISKITDKFVQKSIDKMFLKRNFKIVVPQDVRDFFSEEGYDVLMGARPIARTIKKYIDNQLVKPILKGEIKEQDVVLFSLKDGQLKFKIKQNKVTIKAAVQAND